jgi:hypothetical protein
MGGIIVRETMYQMQEHAGQSPFPTTIGHVTDAVTFNTPHGGTDIGIDLIVCNGCTQAANMYSTSDLMFELRSLGKNPQTSGGFTNWTVIGSECDSILNLADPPIAGGIGIASAVDMHARHAVVYSSPCYCDTSHPDKSPCGTDYNRRGGKWKYTENGPHGLLELYNAVTGRLPSGAERVGSSRHLWLLSTAATAWALLRR